MKRSHLFALTLLSAGALLFTTAGTRAEAEVGKLAPAFTLPGGDGKSHSLSDYKGKTVVLEWTNPGCPFVHKWYHNGDMQKLQKEATAKGVVWLRINSSAPGKQGAQTPAEAATYEKEQHVAATATLLDPDGKVGRSYKAHTTPHMFIVASDGTVAYAGAIDSIRSVDAADIPKAQNYVVQALDEIAAGKPVSTPKTQAYGCSVKYAD